MGSLRDRKKENFVSSLTFYSTSEERDVVEVADIQIANLTKYVQTMLYDETCPLVKNGGAMLSDDPVEIRNSTVRFFLDNVSVLNESMFSYVRTTLPGATLIHEQGTDRTGNASYAARQFHTWIEIDLVQAKQDMLSGLNGFRLVPTRMEWTILFFFLCMCVFSAWRLVHLWSEYSDPFAYFM